MHELPRTGIEFELYRMSISSCDADIAANSSHAPALFLDEGPPPLCACDSEPCVCVEHTIVDVEVAQPTTHVWIPSKQLGHASRACQCLCHDV